MEKTTTPKQLLFFITYYVSLLQIVVNSLVHAVPAIANILVVCMVFWLIFSIMGYQLFGGMFWKCIKPDGEKYHHEEVPDMATCLNTSGAKWINSKINFDSSFHGFLALFQVVSMKCAEVATYISPSQLINMDFLLAIPLQKKFFGYKNIGIDHTQQAI